MNWSDSPTIVRSTLLAHAALGFLTLSAGAVAIAALKGGRTHRNAGKIFVFSLVLALVCALPAIIVRRNQFLGLLWPFTLYMVVRGWREAQFIKQGRNETIWIDKTLTATAGISGIGLLGLGLWRLLQGASLAGFAGAYLGLGFIALRLARRDWSSLTFPAKKSQTVTAHMTLIMGSYTAAITAFAAVNFPQDSYNPVLVWVIPPVIGVIAISWWKRRIERQYPV